MKVYFDSFLKALYPKGEDYVTCRDFARGIYIQPDQIDFYSPTPGTLLKLIINIEKSLLPQVNTISFKGF